VRGSLWLPVTLLAVILAATGVAVAVQTRRPVTADDVDCTKVKCVAITFDDGPSPYTDRLLDVLTANGAKATFFLIGNKVARDPAAAKRIADAGSGASYQSIIGFSSSGDARFQLVCCTTCGIER